MSEVKKIKARRGFAAMPKETQLAIAKKGGQAAHAKGTAHEFSPEEAREAGRKGGMAAQARRKAEAAAEAQACKGSSGSSSPSSSSS